MKLVNGKYRHRPGKTIVDFYDETGKRRMPSFVSREAAKAFAKRETERLEFAKHGLVNPAMTVADYLAQCVSAWGNTLDPETVENYQAAFHLHILPTFGKTPLRDITKPMIRDFNLNPA